MPSIPISRMPDAELVRLISAASAELAKRMSVPLPASVTPEVAPTVQVEKKAAIAQPNDDDCDFVLYVKAKVSSGSYVKAHERQRVAQIAEQYGPWVARQGLPLTHNAGDWQRARQYLSAPRAAAR